MPMNPYHFKMRYQGLLISLIIAFASCGESSDKARIQSIVEEWQGKQIVLPEVMTDFMSGDTINLTDADFTILTYVDSIGCTGCKMKLPLWKNFLNSLDSIGDGNFQFIMMVYPSDITELKYLMKRDDFDYPVYLDADNKVSKDNSFPDKTAFQTFLLDRNMKVTAIGNPTYSSEIAKLYKEIISGQISVSAESRNFVSVSDSQILLGNLRSGESRTREVVFTNQGNDTVRIEKVISSCDCTELSLPRRYIAPKSDLKAVLTFSGDSVSGDFERTIQVYFSDFEYPTIINVSGNIIQ